jgi:hypothetical protein
MKTHTWMLIGALLAIPALGWSDEPVTPPAPSKDIAAKPALTLQDAAIQRIVRAAAQQHAETTPLEKPAAAPRTELSVVFRAPRRIDHTECDSFNCVAYPADEVALFSVPRDQYYGAASGKSGDDWLSCQSHDDLLTTFERYDKCRGVTIGLPPMGFGNVMLDLPKLRL